MSAVKKEPSSIKDPARNAYGQNHAFKHEKQLGNLLINSKMKDLPLGKTNLDKQKAMFIDSIEKHQPSFT